jgi:hypothetical protein
MLTRHSWISTAGAAALVLLTAAACAHDPSAFRPQSAASSAPNANGATVVVRNDNFADMNVYVLRGGVVYQRLGMVTGGSVAKFPISSSVFPDGMLQLMGRLIGGGAVRPDAILVTPGQTVTFMVQPHLAASMAIVR